MLAIYSWVCGLPLLIRLPTRVTPSPSSYQLPIALKLGMGLHGHLPFYTEILSGLSLYGFCRCCCNCCPIVQLFCVSENRFFLKKVIHSLWLLFSFYPLFFNDFLRSLSSIFLYTTLTSIPDPPPDHHLQYA